MASGSPQAARKRSWPTSPPSSATSRSVRVSCQTMALAIGLPLAFSQTSVVSRWLVMPTAATSAALTPALASAPAITASTLVQISSASCSTQPGRG